MRFIILFAFLFELNWAQLLPIAFWQQKAASGSEDCGASPSIGDTCPGGAIYAGTFQGGEYMITPGNCTDSATPTCDGGLENTQKRWRGSSGSDGDIPGVTNRFDSSDPSLSTERGHVITPIIAASALISSDSAADFCNNMTFGGFDDWYLPSKSEAAYIYCKTTTASYDSAYPLEDPNCTNAGGKTNQLPQTLYDNESFMTATPHSSTHGWRQVMNGQQYLIPKSDLEYIKCIRRF